MTITARTDTHTERAYAPLRHPEAVPNLDDPVDQLALEIVASWDAKADREKFARARAIALKQSSDEDRQAHDLVPANWLTRMKKAGVQGVAQTWEGAPVDPSTVVLPGSPFSIDKAGVWFRTERHGPQFVCSPVVHVAGNTRFAALVGGKWKTVDLGKPPAGSTSHGYVQVVLDALKTAGVKFAAGIDATPASPLDATQDIVPAASFVALWLLGVDPRGGLAGKPTGKLPATRAREWSATAQERTDLSGVLSRLPSSIGTGRGGDR